MAQTAQCSDCGAPFRTNGPGPEDGKRFCQQEECRQAYGRRQRTKINYLDPDYEESIDSRTDQCWNCGTLRLWTGPVPADGKRFCLQKACRAAYSRNYYAKINDPEGYLMAKTAQCSNCAAPMHTTGPAPADGKRFCHKNACHAAYLRRRRAKINGKDPGKMENRPCTFCGDPLASRSWRVTDIEAGRWCERNRCRRDKHVVLAQLAEDGILEEVAPLPALDTWEQALIANFGEAKETVCAECDRTDARAGYVHPDPETFLACKGTGYFFHPDLMPQMRKLGWTKKVSA